MYVCEAFLECIETTEDITALSATVFYFFKMQPYRSSRSISMKHLRTTILFIQHWVPKASLILRVWVWNSSGLQLWILFARIFGGVFMCSLWVCSSITEKRNVLLSVSQIDIKVMQIGPMWCSWSWFHPTVKYMCLCGVDVSFVSDLPTFSLFDNMFKSVIECAFLLNKCRYSGTHINFNDI